MTPAGGHKMMAGAFTITVGMIAWQEIRDCKTLPWPPRFAGAAITFGMLDLFSVAIGEELAGVIALGLLIALIYPTIRGGHANCNHGGTAQTTSLVDLVNPSAGPPTTIPGTTTV
jgi:hypothetical protein